MARPRYSRKSSKPAAAAKRPTYRGAGKKATPKNPTRNYAAEQAAAQRYNARQGMTPQAQWYQAEYGNQNRQYMQQWAANPAAANQQAYKRAAQRAATPRRFEFAKPMSPSMGNVQKFDYDQRMKQPLAPTMANVRAFDQSQQPRSGRGQAPYGGWMTPEPYGLFALLQRGMEGPPVPEGYYEQQAAGEDWGSYDDWGYGGGGGGYDYTPYPPAEPEIPTWLYGLMNWRV